MFVRWLTPGSANIPGSLVLGVAGCTCARIADARGVSAFWREDFEGVRLAARDAARAVAAWISELRVVRGEGSDAEPAVMGPGRVAARDRPQVR